MLPIDKCEDWIWDILDSTKDCEFEYLANEDRELLTFNAINAAALFVAFYLKNTKVVGIVLICCGAILLVTVQLWGLPGLVLYIVSGVLALREKLPLNS